MMRDVLKRPNLLRGAKDYSKPPIYLNNQKNFLNLLKMNFYAFFDFQYSTIYEDLSKLLIHVKGKVLDVGCGLQPYRHLLPPNIKYIGIDTKDSQNRFGYKTSDTLYYSGETWPVKNKSIDFLLCTETLEHVPHPMKFLKNAYKVLKPGGTILITVPFAARWHFIPYDYWRYTPSGIDVLLSQSGFVHHQVYARGNQVTVICHKITYFIFTLLKPQKSNFFLETIHRLAGLLLIPVFILFAFIGNLTKHIHGVIDCLGYTILAERPVIHSQKIIHHAKN